MDQPQIISRAEAKAQGLKHFFTGVPCNYGHVVRRFVSSKGCMECARIRSAEKCHADPELYLQKQRAYQNSRRDIERDRHRRYCRSNPEKIKEIWRVAGRKKYYKDHEKSRSRGRECAKRWRGKNKETVCERAREWRRNNPDVVALRTRRRQAQVEITAFAHEREAVRQFYTACPEGHQVDHIVPLNHHLVCGLHVLANFQYLTARDNREKSNKWEPDW